ncbi:MAG: helicase-associated domain-containing protein [Clostridiales bacterium]|jgi:hypothetical protein|nr:helicase-associated domain-containing protein [Clostridiales bacterium]
MLASGVTIDRIRELCRAVDLDIEGLTDLECYRMLETFYARCVDAWDVYDQCSDGEKALIQLHVWNKGYENPLIAQSIAEKHGMKVCNENAKKKMLKYIDPKSPATLLFVNGNEMPGEFLEMFYAELRPVEIETKDKEYVPNDKHIVICREDRVFDFLSLSTIWAGINLTKYYGGMAKKASLAMILEKGEWQDAVYGDGVFVEPKKAKAASSFMITSAMFLVAQMSGMLEEKSEMFTVMKNKADAEIVKKLLWHYLRSGKYNESSLWADGVARGYYGQARTDIMECIETLIPGHFYKFETFEKWVELTAYGFIKGNRLSQRPDDMESHNVEFLEVLLCGFCAMGIVDLAFKEIWEEPKGRRISGVRLTNLGAYVLDKGNEYKPEPREKRAEAGLVVNSDYFAVVEGRKSLLKHSSFLAKCSEKMKISIETARFKLDFKGFAKALDKGINGRQIKEYLIANSSKPVPKKVLKTLDDWIERSNKVKIHTITVIEADDEFLLAEIASIKGLNIEIIPCAAKIEADDAEKIKKALEKSDRYVKLGRVYGK